MVTVKVIQNYTDKHTKQPVEKGAILEVTEKRYQELLARNKVEKINDGLSIDPVTPEKVETPLTQPEKVETEVVPSKKKSGRKPNPKQ